MNLIELREQFLNLSGRADLIDPETYADMGGDYYINSGQRWLDLMYGSKEIARHFTSISAGISTAVITTRCRAIHEVWLYDDEKRWKLEKKDLTWLRENYSSAWRDLSAGTPTYYGVTTLDMSPAQNDVKASDYKFSVNHANVTSNNPYLTRGILILPPPDKDLNLEVWGLFHANPLIDDDSESWWSVNYPNILINAALREVEISHRNTQGVNDWTRAIADTMNGILADQIEESIVGVNQMEG